MVEAEAANQLISQRGFASASGAGDAEHRYLCQLFGFCQQCLVQHFGKRRAFDASDESGKFALILCAEVVERSWQLGAQVLVGARQHVIDHALQPHGRTILR